VQNTRHDSVIMDDFCSYVHFKATMPGVDCHAVFNADLTNEFYSMEGVILMPREDQVQLE
jgi:hypothetical protein